MRASRTAAGVVGACLRPLRSARGEGERCDRQSEVPSAKEKKTSNKISTSKICAHPPGPSPLPVHRDDGRRGALRRALQALRRRALPQRGLAGPQFEWAWYEILLPSRTGAERRPADGERLADLPDRGGQPACERKQSAEHTQAWWLCGALLAVRGWHAPQKSTSFATATGPPSCASEPEPALASLSALVSVPSLFGDAGSFSPSSAPNAMADGGPGGLWRGEPPFTLGVVQGEGASEPLGL